MALPQPSPDLVGEFVRLRRWSYDDLHTVQEASSDPEIPKGTTVPAVYSDEEGRAWIERQWSRQTSGQGLSLAVEERSTDRAIGLIYLGLRKPEGNCEIGYWLVPSARGRGMGAEAVGLASRWVLTDTDVRRVFAHVVPDNAASLATLAHNGYTREGVLRSYLPYGGTHLDVVSLSLLDSDLSPGR